MSVNGDGLTTPSLALASAESIAAILRGIAEGQSHATIGQKLGFTANHVSRIVKQLADEARRENRERVAEAMMAQDRRLEWLYSHCAMQIATAPAFDKDAVRLAILVLERQSKLLGLDSVKTTGPQQRDWLTDAPDSVLIREAERLGLSIPEKFKTLSQNA